MNQEIIRIDLHGVNCYLVKSKNNFVLFDTGGPMLMDKHFNCRQELLVKELEKVGCKSGNLKLIVLTHGDIDHVFNAAYIQKKYNTKIALHPSDLSSVETISVQSILVNFQFRSFMLKLISKVMKSHAQKWSLKTIARFEKFTPDIMIDKNLDLLDYGIEATILHIPGHTDGSIGILFKNGSFICGDTFINMAKPSIAIQANNFKMLDKSIANIKNYGITTILPGHGKPFDFKTCNLK